MNETTWIVSPNWLAWLLLSISTVSLLGLAIYFWSRPNQRHNQPSIISWVAIVLAMSAIVCVFSRQTQDSDSSNLVATLGIMVTLLVGWQIFSLINITRIEERLREVDNRLHASLGELCGDISISQAGNEIMAHVALLFTIHSLIHYSHIGDYEQCENSINALLVDSNIIASEDAELRAMYHRMTGRILHPEKIGNFDRLIAHIDKLFSHPANTPQQ